MPVTIQQNAKQSNQPGLHQRLRDRLTITAPLRLRARRWRTIRRAVAALLLIAAGILVTWPPPPDPGFPVVTLADDVAAGQTLREANVIQQVTNHRPEGALTSVADALGRRMSGAARKGEILTDLRLIPPEGPDPGLGRRAINIHPKELGVLALLSPGMLVSVVGISATGEPIPLTTDAIVLAISEDSQLGSRPAVLIAVLEKDANQVSAATLIGDIALQFH